MEDKIIENLKKITDKEIKFPITGNLKMINTGKLKLLGQNLPCYLGITEDSIVLSIFNKKDLKNEIFQTELYFSKIKEINEKEATLTKQKLLEVIGNDKAYFKFSLNENNNLNDFLEKLKTR
jgi:hypothetical protein